jgi:hypothetical protein
MKMDVFWILAPCSLVEIYDVSEVLLEAERSFKAIA